jgi:hypothetical protein
MPVVARRPDAFCILYSQGPDRSAILGIKPDAATRPDRALDQESLEQGTRFDPCGPEYWRSKIVMDSVLLR